MTGFRCPPRWVCSWEGLWGLVGMIYLVLYFLLWSHLSMP